MRTIKRCKNTAKFAVLVLMAVLTVLLPSTAAFAVPAVTQTLNLEGGFKWNLSQSGSIVPGYSDTIDVGGTTKIQYDIDPSDLKVSGNIAVTITDVSGSVYIKSLDIFMEKFNGSIWEKLSNKGTVCRVPVVEAGSPIPVVNNTTVVAVPNNSYMDVPLLYYSDDIRWATEMTLERDGIADSTIYTWSKDITSLKGP